jgi:ubiquitin carboxyl-terminal hydrolase 25/28
LVVVTKLLSTLFHSLIQDKVASVRPERDLAYLALVSSKDEDVSSQPHGKEGNTSETKPVESGTEKGMKVDGEASATTASAPTINTSEEGLAAAQTPQVAPTEAEVGSPSVLGKRSSDHFDEDLGKMDVDARTPEVATSPKAINSDLPEGANAASAGNKGDMIAQPAEDGVIEIISASEARQSTGMQVVETSSSQKKEPPPLPPRTPSITETNMMFGRQNDVSEAMDNVIFQIESGLDDSKIPKKSVPTLSGKPCSFVQGLFYGTSRQVLEFEAEPESTRIKEEPFCYQLVDVAKDGNDLYDGLDAAFQPSSVEIEGKKVKRQDILTQLPPILQIQLQRVQFDRATSRVYKSNAYMPFPQTLRMGRYLATDGRSPEFASKKKRSIELMAELTKLQATLARLEQKDENQVRSTD